MSEMRENKQDNALNSSETAPTHLFVEAFHAALLDHEKVSRIAASLKAIQDRIDQAYTHICTDLPGINREILLTFQQATDTLDSLSSKGTSGRIETMIDRLNAFLQMLVLQVRQMRKITVRSLEALEITASHTDDVRGLVQHSLLTVEATTPPDLSDCLAAFNGARNDLTEVLERSLHLQNQCIEKLYHSESHEVPSLVYSLNSVINILRDLVSRSRLVKDPILRIMSGLQTHDIVNQDIATISCGLEKILNMMNVTDSEDDITDFLIFQEKASILSLDLIVQLVSVIRSHGRHLEQEIKRIEEMISQVKEDKDAIGGFLLLNTLEKSTLDIVSNEIMEMLDGLASRFDSLAAMHSLQTIACSQMMSARADLEHAADALVRGTDAPRISEPPAGLISCMETREWAEEEDAVVAGFEKIPGEFQKMRTFIHRSFAEIKTMLIQSIDGIDLYSARCLQAIGNFRHDIQGLMSTLDGNEAMLDDMRSLTRSIAAIRSDIGEHLSSHHQEILPLELHQIIYRLRNPHSDSLASEDDAETQDNGLTFF